MTNTATEKIDQLGSVTGSRHVLLESGLMSNAMSEWRVVFHFTGSRATVHLESYFVNSYNPKDDVLLLAARVTCGGPHRMVVYATPEQADYARRVLTLLKPHFPEGYDGEKASIYANAFLGALQDRAEQHVWCVRVISSGKILHANANAYDDYDLECVVCDIERDDVGLGSDEDDEDYEYGDDFSDLVQVVRVPETDIPKGIQIAGAKWPLRAAAARTEGRA